MSDANNTNETLEAIAQVLIRCFVIGVLVLFFWLGGLMLAGDLTYNVQTRIIPITLQQFNVINYAVMLITKTAIFVLFLLPYISIKLVTTKRSK